uniref:competence/damage-inducible protein A n=1 Tax=Gemmiger formicilis TaxID=745368 RepID=UPI004029D902
MTAEIICVGTELLLGDILNTNAQFLSRELAELGISVMHQHVIGDNPARLKELVLQAKSRSDLLVFSGGLGPTEDDLTKETVAEAFGDTLAFDEGEWQKIIDFFARTNRRPTPNNRKQAMCPTVGHKLINDHGTAPGAWFEDADGHCAALMPGVPREMKAMWAEQVRPILLKRQNCTIHSRTLRVLGGESAIASKVAPLFEAANPTAAIYCKTGECEIRITARAETDSSAEKMCRAYATKFYDLLGDAVYDEDVTGLEETLVHTLKKKGLTIATAESCTGGMIAQRLTNVSGASEVFGFGFVTYWEQAKAKMIGVDPAVIAKYNVVSAPVAAQMALGAAEAAGADIAVSVTGLAGPNGGDAVRPVGTVYLGAACGETVYVKKLFVSRPDRALVRARAAQAALELALRLAQGKVPADTQALAKSARYDAAALTALDSTFLKG